MALSIDSLSVYLGGKEILKDGAMSFSVERGQVVGILGPNGCGKSTLLGSIGGLIEKSGGRITVDDIDISALKTRNRARIFSYVEQNERLSAAYTVLESVVMGRYPHLKSFENYSAEDFGMARSAIRRLSLDGFEKRLVTELSGGESARVSIARALTQDAPVFLLDEPTAALDPKHSLGVMRIARELAQDGKIVVAALHDINLAMLSTDRLIFLKEGTIISDRASKDVDGRILEYVYDVPWELFATGDGDRRVAFPVEEQ
ncbi:MAG: ABC transporter ATP-binding protein [Synergistaceae bacterium]|jgi:iron complex transport system ATP-binding protein|nr:ABC transporter ATP-binding protein [Synergistaceae bacterium]